MTHRQFASLSSTKHTMGKGKRKGSSGSSSGDGRNGDQKTLRSAVEKAVNEAVNLQVCVPFVSGSFEHLNLHCTDFGSYSNIYFVQL